LVPSSVLGALVLGVVVVVCPRSSCAASESAREGVCLMTVCKEGVGLMTEELGDYHLVLQ